MEVAILQAVGTRFQGHRGIWLMPQAGNQEKLPAG